MNNTKRTYKHSEAWLAKHASRIADKKNATKPAKKAKKIKTAKPTDAKDKNASSKKNKNLLKQAKKLFNATKKVVSATKKQSKAYGKLMTEALKLNDTKTIERILKMFSRLGYSDKLTDAAVIENIFTVKVKIPKSKTSKTSNEASSDAKPSKKITKPAADVHTDEPESKSAKDATNEWHDEHPTASDHDEEYEDAESSPEEENNEEFNDTSRDFEPILEDSDMRDGSESLRDIEAEMQENGDWEI